MNINVNICSCDFHANMFLLQWINVLIIHVCLLQLIKTNHTDILTQYLCMLRGELKAYHSNRITIFCINAVLLPADLKLWKSFSYDGDDVFGKSKYDLFKSF